MYRVIAIILTLFVMYYCLKVQFFRKLPPYAYALVSFCIVYTIYAICSEAVPNELISKWGMLLWMLPVQLIFFPIYYFTSKGILNEEFFIKLFKVLFLVTIFCYIGNYYKLMNNPLLYALDGYTNNMGYYFLMLLPYTLLLRHRISIIYTILIFALVFFSMKRGAILILLLSYVFYLFINNRKSLKKIIASIFVSIISFVAIFLVLYHSVLVGNEYFEKRVEQTIELDSSGRDNYAKMFFTEISKWDDTSVFLGKGINYSMKILNNFAHNDWFELFYTMGVVGLFIYALYFISLFNSRKYCYDVGDKNVVLVIIVIMLLQTILSMLFFDQSLFYHNILLGYILGKQKLCKKSI